MPCPPAEQMLGRRPPFVEPAKHEASGHHLVISSQVLVVASHAASVASGLARVLPREVAPAVFSAIVDETGWSVQWQHKYGNETGVGKARQGHIKVPCLSHCPFRPCPSCFFLSLEAADEPNPPVKGVSTPQIPQPSRGSSLPRSTG